jgi:hypothetical protein
VIMKGGSFVSSGAINLISGNIEISGSGVFMNNGTFTSSSSGSQISGNFINNDSFQVTGGSVQLDSFTSYGSFQSTGGSVSFEDSTLSSLTISGSGVTFASGTNSIVSLTLSGGSISTQGHVSAEHFQYSNGPISGSGDFNVTSWISISGGTTKSISSIPLRIFGTGSVTGGSVNMISGSTLIIMGSGDLLVSSDMDMDTTSGIVNYGVLNASSSSALSGAGSIQMQSGQSLLNGMHHRMLLMNAYSSNHQAIYLWRSSKCMAGLSTFLLPFSARPFIGILVKSKTSLFLHHRYFL